MKQYIKQSHAFLLATIPIKSGGLQVVVFINCKSALQKKGLIEIIS
jgi:hypothetical protein